MQNTSSSVGRITGNTCINYTQNYSNLVMSLNLRHIPDYSIIASYRVNIVCVYVILLRHQPGIAILRCYFIISLILFGTNSSERDAIWFKT